MEETVQKKILWPLDLPMIRQFLGNIVLSNWLFASLNMLLLPKVFLT